MNTIKRIRRIEFLIQRLEEGRAVTRSSIERLLGKKGLNELDYKWNEERKNRYLKPKEIVEYSKRIKRGLMYYALGKRQLIRGDIHKSKKTICKAEAIFENAVEYLKEVLSYDCSLIMWIDRNLNVGSDVDYSPGGIPRPIWSRSIYKNQRKLLVVTKKDVIRDLLEAELEKLVDRKPLEFSFDRFRENRRWDISSFSDFKF